MKVNKLLRKLMALATAPFFKRPQRLAKNKHGQQIYWTGTRVPMSVRSAALQRLAIRRDRAAMPKVTQQAWKEIMEADAQVKLVSGVVNMHLGGLNQTLNKIAYRKKK